METLRNKCMTEIEEMKEKRAKYKEEKSMEKFRIKKFKNMFLRYNYGGVLKIGKEWVISPKFGGYGLRKGTFLSFVRDIQWRDHMGPDDDHQEFHMYCKEFSDLCGVKHKTVREYVHEFNAAGFYELRKNDTHGDVAFNSFLLKLNNTFPLFKDYWKVPNALIRPAKLGGFGLKHGMVFYYLINKCLSNGSETFEISNRTIAKCFGMASNDIPAILKGIEKTEMAEFNNGMCHLDLEFIGMYFSDIDGAWGIIADNEVKRENIPDAIREFTNSLLFELVEHLN